MTPTEARKRLSEAVEFHQSELVTVPAKLLKLALQTDEAVTESAIETVVGPTESNAEPLKRSRKAK